MLNGNSSSLRFVVSIEEFFANNSKSDSLVCLSKNSATGFLNSSYAYCIVIS